MCGIAGIYGLERIDQPETKAKSMIDALSHRGPDAEGIYLGKNVVLGHRRLGIIDLQGGSNQPFRSPDGRYTLVYNGELYNYRELKAQLSDYPYKTNSDTEVLLAAFMEWGVKALQLFNGMFAFALWDEHEEKLWLVRDRLGIKPLYYVRVGHSIVFSSEVRSLLASGLVRPKLDDSALIDYLRYQCVHAPNTILEGVKMLESGTYLEISDSETKKVDYWKPWQKLHFDREPEVIRRNIREKLTIAVERRLVADVPFGAFLSGGIDSSLIVAIMSEQLGQKVDTFNVSFDESEFSESKYARTIAEKLNTSHHEIRLKPADFLEALPEALSAIDHPSGDGPNTWIVSRETKNQGITMALSGLGGDELFAGYDVFKRIPYIADRSWILSFPKGIRGLLGSAIAVAKPGIASLKTREILTSDYFDLENLYPIFRKALLDPQIAQLTGRSKLTQNAVKAMVLELERYDEFAQLPVLGRIGVAEINSYMQNVLLRDTDQMSMAHALEVRVPFLDHELVQYAMHIADDVKFPHSPKKLLVESFNDLLPNEVVNRPKMGFVLPWEQWMKKELRPFSEAKLESLAASSYFDAPALNKLWQQFLKGDPNVTWSRIWPLVVLSDWMERHGVD
ncbi:MAG: asparagine synthase (glutamine-hydrolyzing) [Flavobacteriales bacterium]